MSTHSTTDTQSKTLFQLCFPLFINSFLALGVTLVDTMIISNYSDNAAAAISIANQVLGVAYDLTGLLGVGAVILVARALGQHKEDEAKKIATIAILGRSLSHLRLCRVLSGLF